MWKEGRERGRVQSDLYWVTEEWRGYLKVKLNCWVNKHNPAAHAGLHERCCVCGCVVPRVL